MVAIIVTRPRSIQYLLVSFTDLTKLNPYLYCIFYCVHIKIHTLKYLLAMHVLTRAVETTVRQKPTGCTVPYQMETPGD